MTRKYVIKGLATMLATSNMALTSSSPGGEIVSRARPRATEPAAPCRTGILACVRWLPSILISLSTCITVTYSQRASFTDQASSTFLSPATYSATSSPVMGLAYTSTTGITLPGNINLDGKFSS